MLVSHKQKYKKPSVEEFLAFVPRRLDFQWNEDENGFVHIIVPKFESTLGKKFCSLLKKDQKLTADMDALGSEVWKHCDGKNTVADILKILEKTFPDEKNLDQRLFLFIQQMGQLHYLTY